MAGKSRKSPRQQTRLPPQRPAAPERTGPPLRRLRGPLVRNIVRILRRSDNGSIRSETILADLRRAFSDADVHAQLDTAIDWGRYGKLYEYDADSDRILLSTHPDAVLTLSIC